MKSSVTDTYSYTTASNSLRIGGALTWAGFNSLVGMMDEVRITKGMGIYTSNFTPSTTPFPNQ
jgi:hypothetical protein